MTDQEFELEKDQALAALHNAVVALRQRLHETELGHDTENVRGCTHEMCALARRAIALSYDVLAQDHDREIRTINQFVKTANDLAKQNKE